MESKPAGDDPSPLAAVASSFPLLVYDHGEPPEIRQTVLSVADESIRTFQVPEMCRYTCLETPQGLVLMVDTASFHCWLWNPQTGEKTALPAMDEELPLHCRCLVSGAAASSSPDPLVLVYDLERPRLLFCRARGGAAWATQSYDMGLEEVPGRPTTERTIGEMAAVKGVFYYLESRDVVGALAAVAAGGGDPEPCRLELATFGATLPTLDTGEELTTTVTKAYLLESAGELFLVCLFYLGCGMERVEEVGAYAMDFTKKEWVKVTDIGDAAFLLGHGGFAASCNAVEHGLKKGCVYFALDFLGDSNDYHIFDLKEGTREVAGPNQDIPTLPLKPFWLVPVLPQNYTLSALVQ